MQCDERFLRKRVKLNTPEHRYSQIDYILVSNRWKSSIESSTVKWGPSIHRNRTGKSDHALVDCTWKWRIRSVKISSRRDWSSLENVVDIDHAPYVSINLEYDPVTQTHQ